MEGILLPHPSGTTQGHPFPTSSSTSFPPAEPPSPPPSQDPSGTPEPQVRGSQPWSNAFAPRCGRPRDAGNIQPRAQTISKFPTTPQIQTEANLQPKGTAQRPSNKPRDETGPRSTWEPNQGQELAHQGLI